MPHNATNYNKLFPLAMIELSKHIQKGADKYTDGIVVPLEEKYKGMKYSMEKLQRHNVMLQAGYVIDTDEDALQVISMAWHCLNCAQEYLEQKGCTAKGMLYGKE